MCRVVSISYMHPYLQDSHFDLRVMSNLIIKRTYLSMSHLNTASKFIFSFAEIEQQETSLPSICFNSLTQGQSRLKWDTNISSISFSTEIASVKSFLLPNTRRGIPARTGRSSNSNNSSFDSGIRSGSAASTTYLTHYSKLNSRGWYRIALTPRQYRSHMLRNRG